VKSTPKKRQVLRHGATSFTGNKRRSRRDQPRRPTAGPAAVPAADATPEEPRDDQRLQKILASAGIGSRRECEELILAGRVEIDGQPVTTLGVRVDSRRQKITLDGELVKFQRRTYYAVNKPTGVLSTNSDPTGRIRVVDLIGGEKRLFTVGRLDQHSEGLIIVTNDGELTQRLTHPKYGVPKIYNVQVAGEAGDEVVTKLLTGVRLEEGIAKAARATIRKRTKSFSILEMVLTEGRNREIRRMLAQLGHKVQRLTRIAVGPIRLGRLKPGQFRMLEPDEIKVLKDLAFRRGSEFVESEPGKPVSRNKPLGRNKPFVRGKFGDKPKKFGTNSENSSSQTQTSSGERPQRPGKFEKSKFEKGKFGKREFGSDKFRKEGAGEDQSAGGKFPRKRFGEQNVGQRKFPERKFGPRKFGQGNVAGGRPAVGRTTDGGPAGGEERKFGKKRFTERSGSRPGGRPGGRFGNRPSSRPKSNEETVGPPQKNPGAAHPLPFLKQRIVLDENDRPVQGQASAQPPRGGKPARKKPLRRLRVRRGKS
jgi:23S rRNA pseudouridine2605 synthase